MKIGKGVRDLSQGPKNVYFVDTARKSLLECFYFLCLSKECKDYNYLIAIILCVCICSLASVDNADIFYSSTEGDEIIQMEYNFGVRISSRRQIFLIMKHIVLISHNSENSWKGFSSYKEALQYMDYLEEQFDDITVELAYLSE